MHDIKPILDEKNPEKQREMALSTVGLLRFLCKLHKLKIPCPTRKVEVDTKSPFKPLAQWMNIILTDISRDCETVLHDTKELLVILNGKQVHPSSKLCAADIVDYFERIHS